MRVLQAIADTSTRVVVVGKFAYRIRKIGSAELGEAGAGLLAMIPPSAIAAAQQQADGDPLQVAEQQAEALKAAISNITPQHLAALNRQQAATVCAGVVAIGGPVEGTDADGCPVVEEWDDVKLLLDEKRANPDKGTLGLSQLPGGNKTVSALYRAILDLTGDDGEAAALVASFRQGARSARTA